MLLWIVALLDLATEGLNSEMTGLNVEMEGVVVAIDMVSIQEVPFCTILEIRVE